MSNFARYRNPLPRMYAYLEGKIAELSPTHVVIDCGGVGYSVAISLHTYSAIKELPHVKLLTHHLVREDAQMLYGFMEDSERRLFLHLISVSGVGANTARMMLSSMTPQELTHAIISGDTAKIQGVKGIGAKTAQRVVIDLRDRIAKDDLAFASALEGERKASSAQQEAIAALVMLGFNRLAAEKAVGTVLKVRSDLSTEAVIKEALRIL